MTGGARGGVVLGRGIGRREAAEDVVGIELLEALEDVLRRQVDRVLLVVHWLVRL